MNAESYLSRQIEAKIDEAKAVVQSAEKAGRSMTDNERANVAGLTAEVESLRSQLDEVRAQRELRESIDALGSSFTGAKHVEPKQAPAARTLGEAFTKSAEYQSLLKSGILSTGGDFKIVKEFGGKANETVGSAGVPAEDYVPGVQLLLDAVADAQAPTLMSVLPSASTDSNRIRYIAETTSTNSAASVAELGTYAQSVLVHADSTVEVEKVGTVLYVSDEFMADASAFAGYIDGRLASFVSYEEEDQVINGDGNTPNLDGILQQVTQTQALGADTYADAIYKAKTDVRTGGWVEPTHILIHPTDWQTIRLSKDANDRYLMDMGPWAAAGASEPGLWGLTPLITQRIAQGTAVVGAFANPVALQLFRRGGVTVEVSNSHASLFITGQVAVRAQSRLALVMYRIGAFSEVTGL